MLTFLTSTDGCIVTSRVRPTPLFAHGLQESKRMLSSAIFFASTDCCVVADGVQCRPSLALFQELQRHLPMLTFLTSTDDRTSAGSVWLNPLIAHGLQESERMLPFATSLATTDCCVVANAALCRPSLALFQELQRHLPMLTFFTSTDGCIVADDIELHIHPVRFEYAQCLGPSSPSAMLCECFAQLLIAKVMWISLSLSHL